MVRSVSRSIVAPSWHIHDDDDKKEEDSAKIFQGNNSDRIESGVTIHQRIVLSLCLLMHKPTTTVVVVAGTGSIQRHHCFNIAT